MIGPHVHMGPIKTNKLNWFPGALGTTGGGAVVVPGTAAMVAYHFF